MKKAIIVLILLVIFSMMALSKVVQLKEFNKPSAILLDHHNAYITEGQSIYIYSLKDFKLIKKFGKGGEGPGEFKIYAQLYPLKNHLQVNSEGKVSFFNLKGEFIKEKRLNTRFRELYPFGDGYVGFADLGWYLYDSNFNKLKNIYVDEKPILPGMSKNNINPIVIAGPDGGSSGPPVWDNKFFWVDQGKFKVYSHLWKLLYVFDSKIKKVEVTKVEQKKYHDFFKNHPATKGDYPKLKNMFKFSKYFPLIKNKFITDDLIYVRTYKMKDSESEFYIFNPKGELINHTFLPVVDGNVLDPKPYSIKDKKIFQLIENYNKEVWELHISKIKL